MDPHLLRDRNIEAGRLCQSSEAECRAVDVEVLSKKASDGLSVS
jgi:hypothetical protein